MINGINKNKPLTIQIFVINFQPVKYGGALSFHEIRTFSVLRLEEKITKISQGNYKKIISAYTVYIAK